MERETENGTANLEMEALQTAAQLIMERDSDSGRWKASRFPAG